MRETIDPETLDTLVGHHRLDFLERRVGSRAVAEELLQAASAAVRRADDADRPARTTDNG